MLPSISQSGLEPGSPEWEARVQSILEDERRSPERLFYLSFAEDDGFRGAIITRAHGPTDALVKATSLGINPGGEMLAVEVPEDLELKINASMLDQLLLTREAIAAATGEPLEDVKRIDELEAGD